MECILCKIQYVGKCRDPLNLRLNNDKKDVNNLNAIPASNHFKIHGHNFIKQAKYSLIEQLMEISNVSKDNPTLQLEEKIFKLLNLKHLFPRD